MGARSQLTFLLAWWILGNTGPSYESMGFHGGSPASTAPCRTCHRPSRLESKKYYRYRCSDHGDFWYCSSCNRYLTQGDAKRHSQERA